MIDVPLGPLFAGLGLLIAVGASYTDSQIDIRVNASNIEHVEKELDDISKAILRIEDKLDDINKYLRTKERDK
jgi:hypothetical protein